MVLVVAVSWQSVLFREGHPNIANRVTQAEALYAKRDNLDRVREGIRLLQQARTSDSSNFDTAWRLAKYCYYLGAHTPDEKERESTFRVGEDAGRAAVKQQPNRPEGHFWLGANIGGRAKASGALAGLSAVGSVRKEMEAVIQAQPGYQDGSAYLVLGQIDLEVPALFGGSKKDAVALLEKGLSYGEQNALLRVRLAEAYSKVRRKDDARKQLDVVLSMKPHPDYLPEYQEAATEARKLLEGL
jgi:hypothetical protein